MRSLSSKFRSFLKLTKRRKNFFFQTLFFLPLFQGYIKFFPLKYLIRVLRFNTVSSTHQIEAETQFQESIITDISWAIDSIENNLPWLPAACLSRAITVKIILRNNNIPSLLYLGVKKEEEQNLKAHAWLCAGNRVIVGKRSQNAFTPVTCFA